MFTGWRPLGPVLCLSAPSCALRVCPRQLVSVDFSDVVIEKMRARHGDACGRWVVGDVTKLPELFPAERFAVVVDKCTVDALTVDPGDKWDPDPATRKAVNDVVEGVASVLVPGGVFMCVAGCVLRSGGAGAWCTHMRGLPAPPVLGTCVQRPNLVCPHPSPPFPHPLRLRTGCQVGHV